MFVMVTLKVTAAVPSVMEAGNPCSCTLTFPATGTPVPPDDAEAVTRATLGAETAALGARLAGTDGVGAASVAVKSGERVTVGCAAAVALCACPPGRSPETLLTSALHAASAKTIDTMTRLVAVRRALFLIGVPISRESGDIC